MWLCSPPSPHKVPTKSYCYHEGDEEEGCFWGGSRPFILILIFLGDTVSKQFQTQNKFYWQTQIIVICWAVKLLVNMLFAYLLNFTTEELDK
jgi:hypothetical protein